MKHGSQIKVSLPSPQENILNDALNEQVIKKKKRFSFIEL
jgi:hypothetical protein